MQINASTPAIVTGGASGLGEATARRLAKAGAKVALLDMNAERGEAVAADIGGLFCAADVTEEASIDEGLARARREHGQERICVTCAGIAIGQKSVARRREDGASLVHRAGDFIKVVEVNLVGTFLVAAKSAAGMVQQEPLTPDGGRGVIVMTSSVAATDGQIGQAAYAASKAGVLGLVLPMARDLSTDGVRVMAIKPGLFHTPMLDTVTPEVRTALEASVPFPSRLGRPAEFARLVEHIVLNDMLNGSAIRLDGAIRMAPK